MNAFRDEARRWAMIARVRALRVRRREVALASAQRVVDAAHTELEARKSQLAHHGAQRAHLLARCAHGNADAQLWRGALVQHRLRDTQLNEAQAKAQAGLARAVAERGQTMTMLRREMLAHDDARKHVREIKARLREET
ncbi:hypothetical protein [Paraburkholderia sacchari]|uniref:Type III secretion protein n=1 Tax=Paraburkholderia sacchari TaxID=159450 RepID=A0A8T6ZPL7_9BURK|nr:hypothetical protein [Paraburkholderia sacchari]NLP65804.1 hypothetical protein [Paraburkholderia sacchari]